MVTNNAMPHRPFDATTARSFAMNSSSLASSVITARRGFLGGSALTLSAGAIALLGGVSTRARAAAPSKDVSILNVALGLEHEAINAYQLGAQSGLLQKPVLDVAVLFQSHHKAHRDALVATIQKLGGQPVAEKTLADYAKALRADTLKSQGDILELAARLELGAANAYLGVIPAFTDTALSQVGARLAADETMHWTALAGALGKSLPGNALSFGG
jgi:rubrerythrin